MAYDPTHEYEHHYEPAIAARKMANAANTKRKNWIATDDRAQEIIDFLEGYPSEQDAGFFCAVQYGITRYGKPTDKMRDKMVAILDQRKAQAAEWAAQDAKSSYIGEVGMRGKFTVTVKHVVELQGMYGFSYINICRDQNGNVVIYKGSNSWDKGSEVSCMAKVKAHEVRDGIKQTIIQRPTKVVINGA
jgi:hypothetical protein